MENNYSVYQHVTPDGFFYFGVTQNVERRWSRNGAEYKGTALQPYIEKFGWDNIQHIVLFKEQTKENALWIEDFLIETAQEDGVCINKNRSGFVSKEEGYKQDYYEQNKQQIREQKKQYYEQNKDKKKQYYEQNKDKIKQYYEDNKQQIREQSKQYYEQNKDKIRKQRHQRYQKNREKELEQRQQRYQKNREKELEQSRQRYQRKKEEKQLKELGCLPLW